MTFPRLPRIGEKSLGAVAVFVNSDGNLSFDVIFPSSTGHLQDLNHLRAALAGFAFEELEAKQKAMPL